MDETEKFLRDKNITIRPSSSSYTHLLFQTATEAEHLSRAALTSIETTRELGKRWYFKLFQIQQLNDVDIQLM
jgi:peroxidase